MTVLSISRPTRRSATGRRWSKAQKSNEATTYRTAEIVSGPTSSRSQRPRTILVAQEKVATLTRRMLMSLFHEKSKDIESADYLYCYHIGIAYESHRSRIRASYVPDRTVKIVQKAGFDGSINHQILGCKIGGVEVRYG